MVNGDIVPGIKGSQNYLDICSITLWYSPREAQLKEVTIKREAEYKLEEPSIVGILQIPQDTQMGVVEDLLDPSNNMSSSINASKQPGGISGLHRRIAIFVSTVMAN